MTWTGLPPIVGGTPVKRSASIKMKLYDNPLSPNARRVRVFLAEKAIELPHEEVSLSCRVQHR